MCAPAPHGLKKTQGHERDLMPLVPAWPRTIFRPEVPEMTQPRKHQRNDLADRL